MDHPTPLPGRPLDTTHRRAGKTTKASSILMLKPKPITNPPTTSQRSLPVSAASMKAQLASSTAKTSKLSRLLWRFVATLIGVRAKGERC